MSDQLRISDTGEIESDPAGPRTWDNEPLYCAETVQEGLFSAGAFAQMSGQMALGTDGPDQ